MDENHMIENSLLLIPEGESIPQDFLKCIMEQHRFSMIWGCCRCRGIPEAVPSICYDLELENEKAYQKKQPVKLKCSSEDCVICNRVKLKCPSSRCRHEKCDNCPSHTGALGSESLATRFRIEKDNTFQLTFCYSVFLWVCTKETFPNFKMFKGPGPASGVVATQIHPKLQERTRELSIAHAVAQKKEKQRKEAEEKEAQKKKAQRKGSRSKANSVATIIRSKPGPRRKPNAHPNALIPGDSPLYTVSSLQDSVAEFDQEYISQEISLLASHGEQNDDGFNHASNNPAENDHRNSTNTLGQNITGIDAIYSGSSNIEYGNNSTIAASTAYTTPNQSQLPGSHQIRAPALSDASPLMTSTDAHPLSNLIFQNALFDLDSKVTTSNQESNLDINLPANDIPRANVNTEHIAPKIQEDGAPYTTNRLTEQAQSLTQSPSTVKPTKPLTNNEKLTPPTALPRQKSVGRSTQATRPATAAPKNQKQRCLKPTASNDPSQIPLPDSDSQLSQLLDPLLYKGTIQPYPILESHPSGIEAPLTQEARPQLGEPSSSTSGGDPGKRSSSPGVRPAKRIKGRKI